MNTQTIHASKILDVVRSTNGGFFSTTFTKKDGTTRKLTGRTGVKHIITLVGKGSTVARPDTPYVTVWDVVAHGYRVINLTTVTEINANGVHYVVQS